MTVSSSAVSYEQLSTERGAAMVAPELIRLLFTSDKWVNRRVDSLSFPDDLTLTRSVGIDLIIPKGSPQVLMGTSTAVLLPIARVRKAPMAQFHFKDEANRSLPLLPRSKVRQISFRMLATWLDIQCGINLDDLPEDDIARRLHWVVDVAFRPNLPADTGESSKVRREIDALTKIHDNTPAALRGVPAEKLRAFGVLVKMFAREHLVLALLEDVHEGQEKIVEYQYDRPLRLYSDDEIESGTTSRPSQVREDLRLYKVFEFPAMSMAYARSYHWQFRLPEGVTWRAAGLYDMTAKLRDPPKKANEERVITPGEDEKIIVPGEGRDQSDPVFIRTASRVDLHATTREEGQESGRYGRWSTLGRARLSLVPSRGTWVGASLAISCMSVVVLATVTAALFGGLWSSDGKGYPSGILSLVLIFVTVAFPPVLRPETGFAKRVLSGARLAAFSGALPPLMLAITINLTHPGTLSAVITAVLLVLASILAFYLYLVWHRANPVKPQKDMAKEFEQSRAVNYRQYPIKYADYYEQFDIARYGPEGVAQDIAEGLKKLASPPYHEP